jgi:uroporphyrinogen decarboxylase
MISRERVLTALNHEEPDRVPVQVDFTPEAAEKLSQHLQLQSHTSEAYSGKVSELPLAMEHDILVAWHGIATSYYGDDTSDTYTCEWGIGWQWVPIPGGRYTEMIHRPLAGDPASLNTWECPDPTLPHRYDSARQLIDSHGDSHVIVGAMPCTLFEAAWYLRGLEQFLTDLLLQQDYAHALLDKIFQFQLVTGTKLAELGVDILWLGDDFGTQQGLLLSPATWREFFKTRYADLIQAYRAVKPDIKIAYHSCGNIVDILPEYIDIGVDIYNAVQPASNDTALLKQKFGNDLCFWGAIDIQHVLPYGTPAEVHAEVQTRIHDLAQGGGYIIAPAHNLQPDTPLENILALYEATRQHGAYPLH